MKKFFSFIFGLMILLVSILPSFLLFNQNKTNKAYATESIEREFYDESAYELISTNPSSSSSVTIESNKAPFDENTKQRMPGSIITPNADDYGQVFSSNLAVSTFSPTENQSIFMWVYLIGAVTFKLSVSIYDSSSSTLTWNFDSMRVYEMNSGWILLELKMSDIITEDDYSSKNYNVLIIKYYSEIEDQTEDPDYSPYQIATTERFSIYHVVLADSIDNDKTSGKIYSVNKTCYKFNENFLPSNTVFSGDEISVDSPSAVFEYLYVGKYDLDTYSVAGKYLWNIAISGPSGGKRAVEFGEKIKFVSIGFYYIAIQLYEKMALEDQLIMNIGVNIYCEEVTLGNFAMGSKYIVNGTDVVVIEFRLSQEVIIEDEINVKMSNKKAEISSYYIDDGILYVKVLPKERGTSKLEISAEATNKHNSKTENYTSEATLEIRLPAKNELFIIILWVVFGGFCVAILIYFVFSVVSAQKKDVK